MCMYYIYIYIYTHTCMCVYIYIYTYIYIMCIYIYICIYTHMLSIVYHSISCYNILYYIYCCIIIFIAPTPQVSCLGLWRRKVAPNSLRPCCRALTFSDGARSKGVHVTRERAVPFQLACTAFASPASCKPRARRGPATILGPRRCQRSLL